MNLPDSKSILLSVSNPLKDIKMGYITAIELGISKRIALSAVRKAPFLNKNKRAISAIDSVNSRYLYVSGNQLTYCSFRKKSDIPSKHSKIDLPFEKILTLDFDNKANKIYAVINQGGSQYDIIEIEYKTLEFRVIYTFHNKGIHIHSDSAWIPSENALLFGATINNQYHLAFFNIETSSLIFTNTQEGDIEKWNYDSKTHSTYGIIKTQGDTNSDFSYSIVNITLNGRNISKHPIKPKHNDARDINKSNVIDSAFDFKNRFIILSCQTNDRENFSVINVDSGEEVSNIEIPSMYSGNTSGLEVAYSSEHIFGI